MRKGVGIQREPHESPHPVTAIRWERRQGEYVEDSATVHLLLAAGVGNRIRRGKGDDRDEDVRILTEQGW
ncbi:hypothetical protein [Pseudoclavibacter helvolus]|uniref:hypothetical protein n=1 Tax=Pseudoclavibacter helvolus TaxID=255205 RepID=UPI000AB51E9C|nr:hypothetical protein [Pseudoclavibacter helvolus]